MNQIKRYFVKISANLRKIKLKNKLFNFDLSFALIFCIAFLIDEFWFYFWYVLSLLGHELSHFFVAKKLGYFPKKIKINFFGAVLSGDDDFLINDEIKIVLAGPFFNFCVIIFCYVTFWFEPSFFDFFNQILMANLALLFFNCLPIFPLDFGRLLLLLLSKKMKRTDAIKNAKVISVIFVLVLFLIYLMSSFYTINFSLGVSAINLMFLVFSNGDDTAYKRQLFVSRKYKLLKRGLLEKTIYVKSDAPLYSLFKFIDDSHFVCFKFLNSSYENIQTLDEIEFYRRVGLL